VTPSSGAGSAVSLFDRVRTGCAAVAERARFVTIDWDGIHRLASTLPSGEPDLLPEERTATPGDEEAVAAEVLAWNAVNFGSGWFPQLRKRPALSGARTLASAFADHVRTRGAPTAEQLAGADVAWCAAVFEQPHPGPVDGLLDLFARAWRDLGDLLRRDHGGSAAALVRSADGSAERLAATLGAMPLAHDETRYGELDVAFYKRAQITVSHLSRALGGEGLGRFDDGDRLTAFADNLVPHTLRMAGALRYDPRLAERIDRQELLAPGEPVEVEIRACGLHAVELLAEQTGTPPAALDHHLWQRGQDPSVKAVPRHRCRCTWY
jgi:hypothetical protein